MRGPRNCKFNRMENFCSIHSHCAPRHSSSRHSRRWSLSWPHGVDKPAETRKLSDGNINCSFHGIICIIPEFHLPVHLLMYLHIPTTNLLSPGAAAGTATHPQQSRTEQHRRRLGADDYYTLQTFSINYRIFQSRRVE